MTALYAALVFAAATVLVSARAVRAASDRVARWLLPTTPPDRSAIARRRR